MDRKIDQRMEWGTTDALAVAVAPVTGIPIVDCKKVISATFKRMKEIMKDRGYCNFPHLGELRWPKKGTHWEPEIRCIVKKIHEEEEEKDDRGSVVQEV